MTNLTYDCTMPNGTRREVKTWAEALAVKRAGGSYVPKYVPVETTMKYECETADGQKFTSYIYAEAREVKRNGGKYTPKYERRPM